MVTVKRIETINTARNRTFDFLLLESADSPVIPLKIKCFFKSLFLVYLKIRLLQGNTKRNIEEGS